MIFSMALSLWLVFRFALAWVPIVNSFEASVLFIILLYPILDPIYFRGLILINTLSYIQQYISMIYGMIQALPMINGIANMFDQTPTFKIDATKSVIALTLQFTWMLIIYPHIMIYVYKRSGIFKRLGY